MRSIRVTVGSLVRSSILAVALVSAASASWADSVQWNYLYSTPPPINVRPAPLVNQSTRGQVGTGSNVLIGGFVIQTRTNVLIRGIGPSLTQFGVTGVVASPEVALFKRETVNGQPVETQIAMNSNWVQATAQTVPTVLEDVMGRIGAFPLARSSGDAAIYKALEPGVYTAHLRGRNNAAGAGLLEIYLVPPEIDPFPPEWWGVTTAQFPLEAWGRQGLAPPYVSGLSNGTTAEFMVGSRVEFTADSDFSYTFTSPEFRQGNGSPSMPHTWNMPRVTVMPIAPYTSITVPYDRTLGMAWDSNKFSDGFGIMSKPSASQWSFREAVSTPLAGNTLTRTSLLTFTTANSGTFTMRLNKAVYNPTIQDFDDGLLIGTISGTFRINRVMKVLPFQPSLNDWRGWWVE